MADDKNQTQPPKKPVTPPVMPPGKLKRNEQSKITPRTDKTVK